MKAKAMQTRSQRIAHQAMIYLVDLKLLHNIPKDLWDEFYSWMHADPLHREKYLELEKWWHEGMRYARWRSMLS